MQKLVNALKVVVLDKKISGWLKENDPKALEQIIDALESDECIKAGPKFVRKLALQLLDDPSGISLDAYKSLSVILADSGNEDILENADITKDGRVYVGEDYVEEELEKLE